MFKSTRTRAWIGMGAMLLSGLGAGCSHCNDHCSTCSSGLGANSTSMGVPAPTKAQFAMRPAPVLAAPAPSGLAINTLPPVAREKYVVPSPQIVVAEKPLVDQSVVPAGQPKNDPPTRRSFPDITARVGMDHAPDYTWLVGELNYNPHKDQWRLRYASIDEEDKYGGSVTLDGGTHQMKGMQSGMMVRVQGSMADPDSREPSPVYRVRDVDPMGRK